MFEVEAEGRDGKKIVRIVYAVEVRNKVTMFLVYAKGWSWMEAELYKPVVCQAKIKK